MVQYTFCLPAYKADYFEEALRSIQKQTYHDFKVIVSDDCSQEELKPKFDKVSGTDSRFVYRRNTENIGGKNLVKHWNLLVDMCETEYLILASDDDIYDSSFLENIDGLVRKYPECDVFRARVRRVDENCDVIRRDACYEERLSTGESLSTGDCLSIGEYCCCCLYCGTGV